MPNKYQIYEVTKVKRLKVKFNLSLPTPEEIAKYMADNGVLNRDELARLQNQIKIRINEAESSVWQRLASLLYYRVKDQIKISPQMLYKLMANFDKIKPFMPNEFWMKVVDVIDKIGEHLYANSKEK